MVQPFNTHTGEHKIVTDGTDLTNYSRVIHGKSALINFCAESFSLINGHDGMVFVPVIGVGEG